MYWLDKLSALERDPNRSSDEENTFLELLSTHARDLIDGCRELHKVQDIYGVEDEWYPHVDAVSAVGRDVLQKGFDIGGQYLSEDDVSLLFDIRRSSFLNRVMGNGVSPEVAATISQIRYRKNMTAVDRLFSGT